MAAEEARTEGDDGRHFMCCRFCGASRFDGTFCMTCFSHGQKLLLKNGDVHAPTEREDPNYTICGMWIAPEHHPVHKRLSWSTKGKEVTCAECQDAIAKVQRNEATLKRRPT